MNTGIGERMASLEANVDNLVSDVASMKADISAMKQDISMLREYQAEHRGIAVGIKWTLIIGVAAGSAIIGSFFTYFIHLVRLAIVG